MVTFYDTPACNSVFMAIFVLCFATQTGLRLRRLGKTHCSTTPKSSTLGRAPGTGDMLIEPTVGCSAPPSTHSQASRVVTWLINGPTMGT